MPTTANISVVSTTPYTWASSSFTWTDGPAQKTWGSATTTSYQADVGETLATVEKVAKNPTVSEPEAFSVADSHARKPSLNKKESFSTSDKTAVSFTMKEYETVTFAEVGGKNVSLPKSESFSITDSNEVANTLVKNVLRSLGIADTYTDNITFILRLMENVVVGEVCGKQATLPKSDSFGITDGHVRQFSKVPKETLAVLEQLARAFTMRESESVNVAETPSKLATRPVAESFLITESKFQKTATRVIKEAVALTELFGRVVTFKRYLSENFTTSDALKKTAKLSKSDALKVFDEYRRHGNAVISDMVLTTDPITVDTFRQVIEGGVIPGYAPFRDFIPGDYDYEFAVFRAVMESENADRARLKTMKLSVDVPDVFDRGSATITDPVNGVRVNFSRSFHTEPEVVLTLKGGTVIAVPDVIDKDLFGFTAILRDPTTGNRVAGTFTWSAHGY